jgi:putative ABC transport system substrate-binding protein
VIPIVFAAVGDRVGSGVVKSLARPGGNATGLSLQATDAVGKRLQLLGEVITGLRRLAIMANSGNPSAARHSVCRSARSGISSAAAQDRRALPRLA